jgi:TonB family protein
LAFCLLSLACADGLAQCQAPRFHKGQDYGASVFVSIRPSDFTLNKLTCLARRLREARQERKSLGVLFFSSRDAAKYFQPPGSVDFEPGWPPGRVEWRTHLHALYSFDAAKHEESLKILPLGYETAPTLVTTIDLPLATTPHCHMEIRDRCLMAVLKEITYPQAALKANASGKVVLTGTINRDGRVRSLRVAEADVNPSDERESLAKAALQNLRTWQFDAPEYDDPIRITYSYTIDKSLLHGGVTLVEWDLPNQVIVRANVRE